MFSKKKGITPVIAIVLLLLITVGAVGVVYTQFQNIAGEGGATDEVNSQQKLQNSDYSIQGVSRNGDGNYTVFIRNTGESTYNLSSSATLYAGVNGDSPVALTVAGGADSCDWTTSAPSPGETTECDTGLSWENSYANNGQSTEFQLRIEDTIKANYQCTETSADSDSTC